MPDLVLRPAQVPTSGPDRVDWVVRSAIDGESPASPDDAALARGGWRQAAERTFEGDHGDLVVQRWVR